MAKLLIIGTDGFEAESSIDDTNIATLGANTFTGNQTISKVAHASFGINVNTSGFPYLYMQLDSTTKLVLGVVRAAEELAAGTLADDVILRASSGRVLFSTDDGATLAFIINEDGTIQIPPLAPPTVDQALAIDTDGIVYREDKIVNNNQLINGEGYITAADLPAANDDAFLYSLMF